MLWLEALRGSKLKLTPTLEINTEPMPIRACITQLANTHKNQTCSLHPGPARCRWVSQTKYTKENWWLEIESNVVWNLELIWNKVNPVCFPSHCIMIVSQQGNKCNFGVQNYTEINLIFIYKTGLAVGKATPKASWQEIVAASRYIPFERAPSLSRSTP